MIIRYAILLLSLFITGSIGAQTTPLSGIINHYAAVAAIDTCTGRLTVSDTTGFRTGNTVLLLQMQGASIFSSNNAQYGLIQNINAAGRYERATIDSVTTNTIFVRHRFTYQYDLVGKVQVVTMPQYTNVLVTDTLKALPWNGTIGGIIALEVADTLTLNAPVWADGAGFRGGLSTVASNNNCSFLLSQTSYIYALGNWRGANKGEGIAVSESGKELGRGPQANGGGGGNDHNAGGGGGGNSSDGGSGGNNDEPSNLGCDGFFPGIGGYSALFTINRVFAGGGGGAGHANNLFNSNGGNGGGLVFIGAGTINGALPVISASGKSAGTAIGDGAGGGGGGGTIWLKVTQAPTDLIVRANGGNGGNTNNFNENRCAGPGGGGAGGRILTNISGVGVPAGGAAGSVINSTNGCNGSANQAESGETGFVQPLPTLPQSSFLNYPPIVLTAPASDTACVGETVPFAVSTNAGPWVYQWQTDLNGVWTNLPGSVHYSGAKTANLLVQSVQPTDDGSRFRCEISRPGCFVVYSTPATLTVQLVPTAAFALQTNGLTTEFINQSTFATQFFWDFGDGTSSQQSDPQHTFQADSLYTIILYAINACDTAIASTVITTLVAPTAGFTVADTLTGCGSKEVLFSNAASANAQTWEWFFPGGNPAISTQTNPLIQYTNSGTYAARQIVRNDAGSDTLSQTFVVQILSFPVADIIYTVYAGGVVRFSAGNAPGTTYLWDFGDGDPTAPGSNIDHQYATSGTYTVTLVASNPCGAAVLQENIEVIVANTDASEMASKLGQVRLYPNPASEVVRIDYAGLETQLLEVQIVNMTGSRVYSLKQHFDPVTVISLSTLPAGAYQIRLKFDIGEVQRVLIKQ